MKSRRQFLTEATLLGAGTSVLSGSTVMADGRSQTHGKGSAEHCIFLWLGGGAAQIDTFDPKRQSKDGLKDPGSAYASIETAIPGVRVCEHLQQTASLLDRAVLVRTLYHEVIDEHAAASYRMHVGRPTSGTVVYPSLGSVITHQKGLLNEQIPGYVLIGQPTPGRSPGFLGPQHGFVYLTDTQTGPRGLMPPERVSEARQARRARLLEEARARYANDHRSDPAISEYIQASRRGFELAGPEFLSVFDLQREPAKLREAYGDEFGQRCLLARRLVERGSRFVEVSFNLGFVNGTGWDTHNEGQKNQHLLIQRLDAAFATLLLDLEEKRLLDKTLVVIATEFGRPAKFDGRGGRGHHAACFTGVLAGGGLRTGQAFGETDELAEQPLGKRVAVPDWFATIYAALGIDPATELYAGDRPVPLTDRGQPVHAVLA